MGARGVESSDLGVAVRLESIVKRFGDVIAVDGVDLEVREGEFFSMLGPSGSGKTTCLRMIAGFERPTEGRVMLDGVDVGDLPPYDRDVNTVFQDYALFPHMSVMQNGGYGLMVAKLDKPGAASPSGCGARDGPPRGVRRSEAWPGRSSVVRPCRSCWYVRSRCPASSPGWRSALASTRSRSRSACGRS
jgi:ABC-type sugar transport system ATPase subunit